MSSTNLHMYTIRNAPQWRAIAYFLSGVRQIDGAPARQLEFDIVLPSAPGSGQAQRRTLPGAFCTSLSNSRGVA